MRPKSDVQPLINATNRLALMGCSGQGLLLLRPFEDDIARRN